MDKKQFDLTAINAKKDEVIETLKPVTDATGKIFKGIAGWYDKMSRTFSLNYITGLPQIKKPTKNYQLVVDLEGIRLSKSNPFFPSPEAFLPWQQISKITSESQGSITRSPSMGKAAVGLLLLGPLGALVGASMGNKHDDRINYISVIYKNELGEETALIFQSNKAHEIASKLNSVRIDSLKDSVLQLKEDKSEVKESDYLNELEKLAELKDKGIITTEEFEKKKKQILNL